MRDKYCTRCASVLRQFNFLEDQPEMFRFYSKARLVGFSNPKGWRCSNSKRCTNTYGLADDGQIKWVFEEVHHAERLDLKDGNIWEIVEAWHMTP